MRESVPQRPATPTRTRTSSARTSGALDDSTGKSRGPRRIAAFTRKMYPTLWLFPRKAAGVGGSLHLGTVDDLVPLLPLRATSPSADSGTTGPPAPRHHPRRQAPVRAQARLRRPMPGVRAGRTEARRRAPLVRRAVDPRGEPLGPLDGELSPGSERSRRDPVDDRGQARPARPSPEDPPSRRPGPRRRQARSPPGLGGRRDP